jgi:hypothetical protein
VSKHTPGPWAVGGIYDSDRDDHTAITVDDGTKYHRRITVARVVTPTNLAPEHPVVAANARLIAAAPDLLEACLRALATIEPCAEMTHPIANSRWTGAIDALRAAIAKAKS